MCYTKVRSLSVSNVPVSQSQAYLQQAQDLVILESIILQTLGKLGRENWKHMFLIKTSNNLFDFCPQRGHMWLATVQFCIFLRHLFE